jgi:hypothetical protein
VNKLRIGLIGCGFMGRAHSNAYRKVNQFFDLGYEPVLQAACARNGKKLKTLQTSGDGKATKRIGVNSLPVMISMQLTSPALIIPIWISPWQRRRLGK